MSSSASNSELPCSIQLTETGVAIKGSDSGGDRDPREDYLVRDRRGRYYAATEAKWSIGVWDSTGTFVRTIGGLGSGPGEFRHAPRVWVYKGDRLHARDATGRFSTYDGEHRLLTDVAGVPISFFDYYSVLPNGTAILGRLTLRPDMTERPGQLFEAFDSSGRSLGRFGYSGAEEQARRLRLIAPIDDTSFWAAPQHRYRLERWTTSGHLLQTIERQPEWFPPRGNDSAWSGRGRMPPRIFWIAFSPSDNVIWVQAQIAAPGAPEDQDEIDRLLSQRGLTGAYQVVHYRLEAIDAATGNVLAARTITNPAEAVDGFLGDGLAYRVVEDANGLRSFTILRVALVK